MGGESGLLFFFNDWCEILHFYFLSLSFDEVFYVIISKEGCGNLLVAGGEKS